MINLNLQFFDHRVDHIPLNTPIIIMQPSCSDTNVCMVFGQQPLLYSLATGYCKEVTYDDMNDTFGKIYVHRSDDERIEPLEDWLKMRILWCHRRSGAKNVQKILDNLEIKDEAILDV